MSPNPSIPVPEKIPEQPAAPVVVGWMDVEGLKLRQKSPEQPSAAVEASETVPVGTEVPPAVQEVPASLERQVSAEVVQGVETISAERSSEEAIPSETLPAHVQAEAVTPPIEDVSEQENATITPEAVDGLIVEAIGSDNYTDISGLDNALRIMEQKAITTASNNE